SAVVDVVGTINVAPGDVGKQGGIAVVVDIPTLGTFQMLSGGIFIPWNGDPASLTPFMSKALPAQQKLTIFNDLVGQYSNLQGLDFHVFMGYYPGVIENIAFTGTPLSFRI